MTHRISRRGFTLTEALISIAILVLLTAIGITSFYSSKATKTLEVITDGVDIALERAKSEAMAGKDGSNFGVYIEPSAYHIFSGSAYTAGDPNNKTSIVPSGWSLSATVQGGGSSIVFSRLTGTPQNMATVTISSAQDPSLTDSIVIGQSGDISVIK